MSLAEICVKRPVFSTVMTLTVILIGVVCHSRLSVRQYPKIEKPVIAVETSYPGANPDIVETQVTKILEGAFATIPGVDIITSHSSNEQSTITIQFHPDRSIDAASSDVRDRLGRLSEQLPHDVPSPTIQKADADTDPIIGIMVTSKRHALDEVRDYVDRSLKNKFEVLNGVARVEIQGGSDQAMHIRLDPHRMAAYGLTSIEVYEAIRQQSVQRPGGSIISKDRQFTLMTTGELNKPEQFNQLIVATYNGKPVRLLDIGHAEFTSKDIKDSFTFNGKQGVGISMVKQSTANPLDVGKEVMKVLPEIQHQLPNGMEACVTYDYTKYIEKSIDRVYRTIIEATILVTAVVFLFLWSFRAILIPLVTIPVSLIGTFVFLYFLDFSINVLTLLAMVLAIGLVVDDAIVVLENVHRHMEKGASRIKAAIEGTKEISFAVIAMTLTLVAAYSPIALTQGKIGRYFREFAVVLAGSVLISGFVALTLSPMMCSKLLKNTSNKKHDHDKGAVYSSIEFVYSKFLQLALNKRAIVLSICAVISVIGYMILAFHLPTENAPAADEGKLKIRAYGPTDATYTYLERYSKKIAEALSEHQEVDFYTIGIQNFEITGTVTLKDWSTRSKTSREIADELKPKFSAITGIQADISASKGGSGSDSDMVEFVLETTLGYPYLEQYGVAFSALLKRYNDLFSRVEGTIVPSAQEYTVEINRERAASLGVRVWDIADTIETLIRGKVAGHLKKDSKRYEVFVKVSGERRKDPKDILGIFVKSREGTGKEPPKMVPLSDLVDIKPRRAPVTLDHYDQLLSVNFQADVARGCNLGKAIESVRQLKDKYLPDDILLNFSGSTKSYLEDSQQIYFIFGMALLFIYFVLSAQFESFIDPLTILLSVPLSMAGALITLALIPDGSLNMFSKIGLVTLIGLITKHGILIVDFANKLQEKGESISDAISKASILRLRPILMTTFAMVLGAVPLALGTGAGAEARRQIGWVVVGGMLFGTLFTLFIVPVVYTFFSRSRKKPALKKQPS